MTTKAAEKEKTPPAKKQESEIVQMAKKRRAELVKEKAELVKKMQPHRDYLDKVAADQKLNEARKKVKEYNVLIGPIDQALADCARLIGTVSMSQSEGK
jgi:hypothetical protein